MVGRDEGQHGHDEQHPEDVPPDADVVQLGHDAHAELVERAVQDQDRGEQQDRVPRPRVEAPLQVEQGVEEERRAEVDARRHRHLAQEVEPAGEPRPGGGVVLGQLGRPVVQAAGRREAGADFGHGQADQQRHHPDERPAPGDQRGAAGVHPGSVEGQAAGQDRDDRERDGEVREAGHVPAKFLRVAHLVQAALVGADRCGCGRGPRGGGAGRNGGVIGWHGASLVRGGTTLATAAVRRRRQPEPRLI